MTPAELLTALLESVPREHRGTVLEMLELFNALTPRHRAAWLESIKPKPPARTGPQESAAELFDRGMRIVKGDSK
jgi:hypothetical protein